MESDYHEHFWQKYLNHLWLWVFLRTCFNHMHLSDTAQRLLGTQITLETTENGQEKACCTVKAENKKTTFCVSHSTAPLYVNISTTHQHLWGVQFTF